MLVPVSPSEEADFHIPSDSPAAGFGIPQDFMPKTDKDGHPRTTRIDAGAYQATDDSSVAQPTVSIPAASSLYNHSGQVAGSSYHGIIISNGKKFFVR